ncbi:hypothetical protein IV203_013345 [Nitzschia inconspicua]|uniref:Uncharacterized protein n=1 Tax=Nitzschia inconspicua TaxID=303405 RepID=A0A9K3M6S5_9STRA|nr:hypothetical protein IV203_013345 [Nitzschia inconspicua]
MAEFDSKGFAAVDKFFGRQDDERDDPILSKSSLSLLTDRGQRRGGVGAVTSNKKFATSPQLEQVLKVGRKKRLRQELEDDLSLKPDEDDGDDEMDLGRTAIAKDTQTKTPPVQASHPPSSKKSKKKGKKERQKMNQQIFEETHVADPLPEIEMDDRDASKNELDEAVTNPAAAKNSNNKRKRRKVRSRQKNIRKDTRPMADKPAHLIPGNPNYQGRPMTQATREKLKHPVSTGKKTLDNKNRSSNNGKRMKAESSKGPETLPKNEGSEELFVIDRSSADDVGVAI